MVNYNNELIKLLPNVGLGIYSGSSDDESNDEEDSESKGNDSDYELKVGILSDGSNNLYVN